MIGGMEVAHNFFITKDKLNGKDIILGQPWLWLFSHSTWIDYIHNIGMAIQVWNEGDQENGASVKIKLPILTAPRNIFPIYGHPPIETTSVEVDLSQVSPGDNVASLEPPKFLSRISKAFELPDQELKELWPDGLERSMVCV